MNPIPGHWEDGGQVVELGEELGVAEAGVALSAVGVEDLQRRPPPWWAGAVARDDHLRSLTDDVASDAQAVEFVDGEVVAEARYP